MGIIADLGPRIFMEMAMRNYSALSKGRTISIDHCGKAFLLDVVETQPADSISLYGTVDLEVDFLPPRDAAPGSGSAGGASASAAPAVPVDNAPIDAAILDAIKQAATGSASSDVLIDATAIVGARSGADAGGSQPPPPPAAAASRSRTSGGGSSGARKPRAKKDSGASSSSGAGPSAVVGGTVQPATRTNATTASSAQEGNAASNKAAALAASEDAAPAAKVWGKGRSLTSAAPAKGSFFRLHFPSRRRMCCVRRVHLPTGREERESGRRQDLKCVRGVEPGAGADWR